MGGLTHKGAAVSVRCTHDADVAPYHCPAGPGPARHYLPVCAGLRRTLLRYGILRCSIPWMTARQGPATQGTRRHVAHHAPPSLFCPSTPSLLQPAAVLQHGPDGRALST